MSYSRETPPQKRIRYESQESEYLDDSDSDEKDDGNENDNQSSTQNDEYIDDDDDSNDSFEIDEGEAAPGFYNSTMGFGYGESHNSASSDNEQQETEKHPFITDVALKMVKKMGWEQGQGLGM